MEKQSKTKENSKKAEESCCADMDCSSIECKPKPKKSEVKCSCGGLCK